MSERRRRRGKAPKKRKCERNQERAPEKQQAGAWRWRDERERLGKLANGRDQRAGKFTNGIPRPRPSPRPSGSAA